tara:strand:- start:3702 stop:4628 length:927 start_codon:yes stop_codon:yes gene_type:complete
MRILLIHSLALRACKSSIDRLEACPTDVLIVDGSHMTTDMEKPAKSSGRWHRSLALVAIFAAMLIGFGVSWAAGNFQQVEYWRYREVAKHDHNRNDFTQGLLVHEGILYEGTGQFGESKLQRIDLSTGRVLNSVSLNKQYFGEGIAIANGELFQLTWKNRVAFVYDPETLRLTRTVRYAGEGWGLTFDGESLIMSDGSATLRFYDPKEFNVQRRVTVHDGKRTIDDLNELEYIQGEVWANIWHQDKIVRIDPETGRVKGYVDLGGLKPLSVRLNREAVYNGIAWDEVNRKLYVTGKNWPTLYEIQVTE